MSRGRLGVGLIGAGNISDEYLRNLTAFPDLHVLAVGDLQTDRARAQAEKYDVASAGGPETVLEHPDIEIVVNLTIPAAHVAVSEAAIDAGKHVWSEKPVGTDRASARALVNKAEAAGLRVGVAPDTVLGPGFQAAKRAIERGDIGEPIFAATSFQWQGPELFHPDPEFLYARGGGPLLDMGPYYVSALVHVFGPVARVAAVGTRSRESRAIQVGPRAGTEFPVEIPSTVSTLIEFERGGYAQSLYSTDSPLLRQGLVEITGTEGTLTVPDPNRFDGAVTITRPLREMFTSSAPVVQETVDVPREGVVTGRGLGVLDMARAIREGRSHMATGRTGYHVLDTLLAIEEAVESGERIVVESTVDAIPTMARSFDPTAETL